MRFPPELISCIITEALFPIEITKQSTFPFTKALVLGPSNISVLCLDKSTSENALNILYGMYPMEIHTYETTIQCFNGFLLHIGLKNTRRIKHLRISGMLPYIERHRARNHHEYIRSLAETINMPVLHRLSTIELSTKTSRGHWEMERIEQDERAGFGQENFQEYFTIQTDGFNLPMIDPNPGLYLPSEVTILKNFLDRKYLESEAATFRHLPLIYRRSEDPKRSRIPRFVNSVGTTSDTPRRVLLHNFHKKDHELLPDAIKCDTDNSLRKVINIHKYMKRQECLGFDCYVKDSDMVREWDEEAARLNAIYFQQDTQRTENDSN